MTHAPGASSRLAPTPTPTPIPILGPLLLVFMDGAAVAVAVAVAVFVVGEGMEDALLLARMTSEAPITVTVVAIPSIKIVGLALAVAKGAVEFAVQQLWLYALLGEQQNSLLVHSMIMSHSLGRTAIQAPKTCAGPAPKAKNSTGG